MSEQAQEVVEQSAPEAKVGSGDVAKQVLDESGLAKPVSKEQGEAIDKFGAEVEAAVEAGASDKEIQKMVETFRIKANGKEREVVLDWNNKEAIKKKLEMAEAAPEAFQKAAEYEKAYNAEMERLRSNPWEVLKELGLDPDKLSEDRLQKRIDDLQKSPEQIEREQMQAKISELMAKLEKEEQAKQEAENRQMQDHWVKTYDDQITKAISATTELPRSPYVVKRVIDAMEAAMRNGFPEVTAFDVAPVIEQQMTKELQEFYDNTPDKMLDKILGAKTIDRLKKQRLAQMPAAKTAGTIKDTGVAKVQEKPRQKQSLNDFLKHGLKRG